MQVSKGTILLKEREFMSVSVVYNSAKDLRELERLAKLGKALEDGAVGNEKRHVYMADPKFFEELERFADIGKMFEDLCRNDMVCMNPSSVENLIRLHKANDFKMV